MMVFGLLLALVAVAVAIVHRRYRRHLGAIRARLRRGSALAATAAGMIEYASRGDGPPVLVIHGAGGGYDQGLLVAADFLGGGFRVIAPSRFGYLRTPLPPDVSPAAQADAHAALLDKLGVDKAVVVGVSAGAPSAMQLALRHAGRVSALILGVPAFNAPGHTVDVDPSFASRLLLRIAMTGADFAWWAAMTIGPRAMLARFLAVPPALEAAAPAAERGRVTAIIAGVLPLSDRLPGIRMEAAVDVEGWPLETIAAPVLIIAAADDLYNTLPGARHVAARLANSQIVVFPSGGHLLIGRGDAVRRMIADFLAATGIRAREESSSR